MGRKRKLFTTGVVPIGGHSLKSRREARKVTSRFHQLQNEIGQILNTPGDSDGDDDSEQVRECGGSSDVGDDESKVMLQKKKKVELLEKSIEAMGGRDRYQQASVVTTAHHSTSKWVVSVLNKLGVYPKGKHLPRLKTLEVGAINTQLQKYPGLDVRAIDINSQHAQIEELDFFDLPPTPSHDVIVCSMVVNCVDTAMRRGEMLVRLSAQMKQDGGVLFLVLPTKCINNEFLTNKQFLQFLKAINLVVPTSEHEYFKRLFPDATNDASLDDYCSRLTPKLSFFVLVHQSAAVTPLLSACSISEEFQNKNVNEDWFESDNFHHILKAIRIADHAGLLNHFKPRALSSASSHKSSKKEAVVGRFNSSEFKISIPDDVLTTATSIVNITGAKAKKVPKKKRIIPSTSQNIKGKKQNNVDE